MRYFLNALKSYNESFLKYYGNIKVDKKSAASKRI
jgi:hypothetical protein